MAYSTSTSISAHVKRLRAIRDSSEPAAINALLEIGELVRQEAMRSIREGTVRGLGHVPSLPGQPPAGDTGRLEMSIEVELRRSDKTVNVIANAPYAAALEFGTRQIAARPFLRPAMQKHRSRLVTALAMTMSGRKGVKVLKNSSRSIDEANDIINGS